MQRLKKGDKVRVISGRERGKEGKILKVYPKLNTAEVEGINLRKRHQKANQEKQTGEIVEISVPVNMSKLALIDNHSKGKHTKVKFGFDKNNKKVRISKISNHEIGGK
ncbi:MAG: 50S ribosomal protein L24 [Malacoplasma sp.]|nr:50S ribosomal protein L24 [Malacoplasma sp.]